MLWDAFSPLFLMVGTMLGLHDDQIATVAYLATVKTVTYCGYSLSVHSKRAFRELTFALCRKKLREHCMEHKTVLPGTKNGSSKGYPMRIAEEPVLVLDGTFSPKRIHSTKAVS